MRNELRALLLFALAIVICGCATENSLSSGDLSAQLQEEGQACRMSSELASGIQSVASELEMKERWIFLYYGTSALTVDEVVWAFISADKNTIQLTLTPDSSDRSVIDADFRQMFSIVVDSMHKFASSDLDKSMPTTCVTVVTGAGGKTLNSRVYTSRDYSESDVLLEPLDDFVRHTWGTP